MGVLPKYVGPDTSGLDRLMTQAEIKARFDAETAAAYSQSRPRWLPDHGYAMSLVTSALRTRLAPEARVLDLGAGTGNLSRRVLKAFRACSVTLSDFSENMLGEVPKVLAGFEGRFTVRLEDFWEADYPSGSFDAVVSSFALHHGRGEAVYLDLYRRIRRWLAPSGIFVCLDVVAGDSPEATELDEAGWRGFLERRKFADADIERILSNYHREDSPLSLRHHMLLLGKAGFEAADVMWKRYNFAVYSGAKVK